MSTSLPYQLSASQSEHIGDRAEMQDRSAIIAHPTLKGYVLAVVADGMGGRSGGAIAAQQVITTAQQLMAQYGVDESPESLLEQLVIESHSVIRLLSISDEKEPHSTVVAVFFSPTAIHWVHAGDSRMYRFRLGELAEETRDHSFVNMALEQGIITAAEAEVHPQRNMITSALGTAEMPSFDLGKLDSPMAGDFFVLSSDGFWAYLDPVEISDLVMGMNIKSATNLMMELARERAGGRGDNVSMIVLKLNPVGA